MTADDWQTDQSEPEPTAPARVLLDGPVGRRSAVLTCQAIRSLGIGDYGERFLCRFTDASDNIYVWFTGENLNWEEGETHDAAFTVKEHQLYNGQRQAVIQRVRKVVPK